MTTVMYRWLYRLTGNSAYDGAHRRFDEPSGDYPQASYAALGAPRGSLREAIHAGLWD